MLEVTNQDSVVFFWILLVLFLALSGWFELKIVGSRGAACLTWTVGVVVISVGIAGLLIWLGAFRWLAAIIVLASGFYAIYRLCKG